LFIADSFKFLWVCAIATPIIIKIPDKTIARVICCLSKIYEKSVANTGIRYIKKERRETSIFFIAVYQKMKEMNVEKIARNAIIIHESKEKEMVGFSMNGTTIKRKNVPKREEKEIS